MSELRIFSYLPNPRIWKATIAARLCGINVEVKGTSPKELAAWLWDFDARPLSSNELAVSPDAQIRKVGFQEIRLHKTSAFMAAHPFGAVPAAFSPDGKTGIFESNSIMRAVARLRVKPNLCASLPCWQERQKRGEMWDRHQPVVTESLKS
jgi:hypothetical protein